MLKEAQLQGATLSYPHLQGAVLDSANIRGAKLQGAELQGASLANTQLQGTDFQSSTLAGTILDQAEVWRTDFENALSVTTVFWNELEGSELSKNQFASLKSGILHEVPEGTLRDEALKHIELLNPDLSGNVASARKILETGRVDETAYHSALAVQLKNCACSGDNGSVYIVRGLIANGRIKGTGAEAPLLVDAILAPDCPVFAALTYTDKAALRQLAKEAQTPESKQ